MIHFYKFDGAGNDFILVDIRQDNPRLQRGQIARLCHRRFGIGADGLMTLDTAADYDFEMRYYNSDGHFGSMCGNGGRCITAFAHLLGIKPADGRNYHFLGYDGEHTSELLMWDTEQQMGIVRLQMRDVAVAEVHRCLDGWSLDTGSPHYVQRVDDVEHYDVVGEGRRIRYNEQLFPAGTNVDFMQTLDDGTLFVRTYERGVEDETWACGTGVTAAAIVSGVQRIITRGGDFKVTFRATGDAYRDVQLIGPVAYNFKGEVSV